MKLCPTMPGDVYIISDLHLSKERPGVFTLFEQFIDALCQDHQCQALYILGDFFDYWIGDDDLTVFNQKVINQLKRLSQHHIQLYFMHGNRDFFIGKRFAKMTGATLLEDDHFIDYHDRRIMLCHGDTLCTDDRSYQRFRFFARIKWLQAIYLILPLKLRRYIAHQLRNKSQNKGQRLVIQVDVTDQGVNRYRDERTILIHGHTHKMDIHRDDDSRFVRAVLGDWHDQGSYIHITDQQIELKQWPDNSLVGTIYQHPSS